MTASSSKKPSGEAAKSAFTKQEELRKLKNKMVEEASRFLPLDKNHVKRKRAEILIETLNALDLESEQAEKSLESAIDRFYRTTSPAQRDSKLHQFLAEKGGRNISPHIAKFLTTADVSRFAQTSLFSERQAKEVQRVAQAEFRVKIREPILQGVQEKRWRYSYPPDLEAEQQEVDDILKSFESQCHNINYPKLYGHFKKLALIGIWTLNETQLILLSDDTARITRWVRNNEDNLREPIDNVGLCALHYLAFNNQVTILTELRDKKNFPFMWLHDQYRYPLFHLAALGGATEAVCFFNERLSNSITGLSKNNLCVEHFAAAGGDIKTLEKCLFLVKSSRKQDEQYKSNIMQNACISGKINMMRYCREILKYDMTTIGYYLSINCSSEVIEACTKEFKCDLKIKNPDKHFSFPLLAVCNPFNAITMLDYAKDVLKCDLNKEGSADGSVTIIKMAAAYGRAKTLAHCIDKLNMNPVADSKNDTGVIAAAQINYETVQFCMQRNIIHKDLYTSALIGGNMLILLTCRLFEINTQINPQYTHLIPPNSVGHTYDKFMSPLDDNRYIGEASQNIITEWKKLEIDTKKDIFDKCISLLDTYLKQPKTIWVEPYLKDAALLKKRVQQLKGQHPVELFLCLNYRILDSLKSHRDNGDIDWNPFALCVRLMVDKVLAHTLELRKNLLAKAERGSAVVLKK